MTFTINPYVRALLYVVTALGTPVVAYLFAKGYLGTLEVTLWSAEVTVVSTMAAFHTTTNAPVVPVTPTAPTVPVDTTPQI